MNVMVAKREDGAHRVSVRNAIHGAFLAQLNTPDRREFQPTEFERTYVPLTPFRSRAAIDGQKALSSTGADLQDTQC